jgi:hypothetical protein
MRSRVLAALAGLSLLCYLLILTLRLPVFKSIPGYFWHFMEIHVTPLPNWWLLVPVILLATAVISLIGRSPQRSVLNILLLIVLGYVIQMSFGFMSGRGIDGIRSRMVVTGHAEFARVAALESDMLKVASDYENFCRSDTSLKYVNTKPPGHLLFHMFAQKVSNLIKPRHSPQERFERLVTFASLVFPLVTYLVLVPMYLFGKLFFGDFEVLMACCFYVVVPSVVLVTLHLDQVLYPFLFIMTLYLVAKSVQRGSLTVGGVAGGLMYLSTFVSFSLLSVIPLALGVVLVMFYSTQKDRVAWHNLVRALVGLTAGFVILLLTGLWLLDYNPLLRFSSAMAYHRTWKHWQSGVMPSLKFAGPNLFEFAWWLGLPLAALFVIRSVQAIRTIRKQRLSAANQITLMTAAALLLLALFGQTKGEVARLWIFLMPLVCFGVAASVVGAAKRNVWVVLSYFWGLQLLITLLIKRYQDFW